MRPLRFLLLLFAFAAAAPIAAQQLALGERVAVELAEAPTGTRFGLLVVDEDGRETVAINADGRFIPASNTKLLTTAAAFAFLPGLDQPDAAGGTRVLLQPRGSGPPDVVLFGAGDARLSSAADCTTNCLAALADAIAARTRRIHDVIGDDSLFPDQRWSPGMSWNNIETRSGTGISALTLDDNELTLRILPGAPGTAPRVEGHSYFRIVNRVATVADGATAVSYARMPGSLDVHLTGTIKAGGEAATVRLGIDDPAHYAAQRLRTLLEARGVRIGGSARGVHRFPAEGRPVVPTNALAISTPPPLAADIAVVNKVSQNVHAELLMRRLGLLRGDGSIEDGVAVVDEMMGRAGVPRTGWDLSDGSGMSTYNRISPRAMVGLLNWAKRQPWGTTWREGFPVAGVDGTLTNRFRNTPLAGRLFAKTGTLNATNALSGYLIAASGRTLTFSFFANDVPGGGGVTPKMDEVLNLIAAAN